MSRLKIIYIASLILLGLMVSLTVFKPLAKGAHYNDVQRESLIKSDQEWVLQFSLINNDASRRDLSDQRGQGRPAYIRMR